MNNEQTNLANYHRSVERREFVALLCIIPPSVFAIIFAIRFIVNLFY